MSIQDSLMKKPSRAGQSSFRIPELLAPAGSFDKLTAAIHYGADAVYLGGQAYSLRARAANFNEEGLRQALRYAHDHGVKVYVTVNIFAHNRDLDHLEAYLLLLREIGVDGCIISDPGVLAIAKKVVPELPIHLSTQANVTNSASACFWAEQGVRRINLARELGLTEIRAIRAATTLELEVFVHGALCIAYSGRCLLSTYLTGRHANQGDCAHPCRYSYALVEEKRPGQYFPVEEDKRGTYIFNVRDLCLLGHLPALVEAGVDAIKIEGRMKSAGYIGAVVRVYRLALDWLRQRLSSGQSPLDCQVPEAFHHELSKIGTRGQTENFFMTAPSADDMLHDTMRLQQHSVPVGIVRATGPTLIETRHALMIGDQIECLHPEHIEPAQVTVIALHLEDGTPIHRANPGNRIVLTTAPPLESITPHTLLRKQIQLE